MKSFNVLVVILFFLLPASFSLGQDVTIAIETENVATVLKTDANNRLKIIYFGNSLANTQEYERTSDVFNFQAEGASSTLSQQVCK
ncbi:MAG: hypothetical protein PHI24_14600 [Desulfitobacteriaceae bacterium]|nr:hypothetical protein [Desulfitobacteriaceae bacterium]